MALTQKNNRVDLLIVNRAFSRDVTAAMLVPKQRNGGHVGVPNQSIGNKTLFLCKLFSLF